MVANAKQFNEKNSPIFEDAERVRKTASNFMTKHNPAYRNPHYVAVATPLPEEEAPEDIETPPTMRSAASGTERSRRSSQAVNTRRKSASAPQPDEPEEAEDGDEEDEEEHVEVDGQDVEEDQLDVSRFKGKTFQDAQDMIIEELIDYTE